MLATHTLELGLSSHMDIHMIDDVPVLLLDRVAISAPDSTATGRLLSVVARLHSLTAAIEDAHSDECSAAIIQRLQEKARATAATEMVTGGEPT